MENNFQNFFFHFWKKFNQHFFRDQMGTRKKKAEQRQTEKQKCEVVLSLKSSQVCSSSFKQKSYFLNRKSPFSLMTNTFHCDWNYFFCWSIKKKKRVAMFIFADYLRRCTKADVSKTSSVSLLYVKNVLKPSLTSLKIIQNHWYWYVCIYNVDALRNFFIECFFSLHIIRLVINFVIHIYLWVCLGKIIILFQFLSKVFSSLKIIWCHAMEMKPFLRYPLRIHDVLKSETVSCVRTFFETCVRMNKVVFTNDINVSCLLNKFDRYSWNLKFRQINEMTVTFYLKILAKNEKCCHHLFVFFLQI